MELSINEIPLPVRMAMLSVARYKTRDPFEIIERRNVKLWRSYRFTDLLGFFVIKNKQPYICINANADEKTQRVVTAHELGHEFLHYLEAVRHFFHDTMLYSVSVLLDKMEQDANLFAGELLLDDDDVLEPCGYYVYVDAIEKINANAAAYKLERDRRTYKEEALHDFYTTHDAFATVAEMAVANDVDVHVVEYKLLALQKKGFTLPNLPEVRSDFLRR